MPNYPLQTAETFDPDAIWAIVKKNGGKEPRGVAGGTLRYLKALKADCATLGISGRWALAQWDLETGNPKTGNGGQSAVWVETGNPGGIAVFPDGSTWGLEFTPETAARAQATHLARYLGIPNVPEDWIKLDARWQAVADKGWVGTVVNVQDLGNGKWATDAGYADSLIERYTKYFGKPGKEALVRLTTQATPSTTTTPAPVVIGGQEGTPTVAENFKQYTFPGLPEPVYLPSWIQVDIMIIPSSTPGWTSGQKIPASNFTTTTYHDTGNPSSSALSEYTWARNGGRAGINSAGSYNGIFDKNRIIITQRFDELVGHAANPTGNVTSYAFEEAYGAGGHAGALIVGQWLHAGVLQAMGKSGGTASMVQHNYWSGKDCPSQIRANGEWSKVEKAVDANVAAINAWLKAGGAGAGTTTPKPVTLKKGDTVAASEALNLRQAAGTSAAVVTILAAGDTGTITGASVVKDGYTWWPLTMASGQSGYAAQDWLTKTNAPTTTPKPTTPTYATPMPIPALVAVDTTKPDTAPGAVVDGGTDFVFVGDLVEVTKGPLKRLQRSGDPSTTVGPDLKVGDRFIASWLYRVTDGALEGALVYVTPTWERVVYKDADGTEYTKRIADVPELTAGAK